MNLETDRGIPLIGFVGRLTHQKGVDLIAAAIAELAALPAQFALLGKGERGSRARLPPPPRATRAAWRWPPASTKGSPT